MIDVTDFAVTGSIVRWIPQVIHLHQPSTVGTVAVVVLLAGFAEWCGAVTQSIIPPDAFAAAVTEQRFRLQAFVTEVFALKPCHSGNRKHLSTSFAG